MRELRRAAAAAFGGGASNLTRHIVRLGELAALLGLKQRRLKAPLDLSAINLIRLARTFTPEDTGHRSRGSTAAKLARVARAGVSWSERSTEPSSGCWQTTRPEA
jgi:hypothetical protein